MMTVRFPNGQAVVYNRAYYVTRSQHGYSDLYGKKDGEWIAQIPNTCIIESEHACRVYNALDTPADEVMKTLKRINTRLGRLEKKGGDSI